MITDPLDGVLVVARMAGYAGFVLWAGPLVFWSLVWPGGHHHRRLFGLATAGALLQLGASLVDPLVRVLVRAESLSTVAPPLAGAAVLLRLAVLVGSLFFLVDLLHRPLGGVRRLVVLSAVVVVAATLAGPPAVVGQPGPVLSAVGTAGHLLATAAWLGGLVALAVVMPPGHETQEVRLVSRFSPVASLGLVLLVVAGALTTLAPSGGLAALTDRSQSRLLLAKLGLLLVLLLAARFARRATARLAFRRLYSPMAATGARRQRALAVVVGAELAIAFAALSATALVGLVV